MLRNLTLAVLVVMTTACGSVTPEPASTDYATARAEANRCLTNYGEVVIFNGTYHAYCVPNDVSEACIDRSSTDCAGLTAEACDSVMTQLFEACIQVSVQE